MTPERRHVLGLAALAALVPAFAQDGRDEGMAVLAAQLEKQLTRRKGALPLPWRESILDPDRARLVWHPRNYGTPAAAGDVFRVAFDPVTRWYFVVRVPKGGARTQYFGPFERQAKGGVVEAFAKPVK